MKVEQSTLLYISIGVVVGIIAYTLWRQSANARPELAKPPFKKETNEPLQLRVAKALTEKGCILYGSEECPFCVKQKQEFGEFINEIDYVDCQQTPNPPSLDGIPSWFCKQTGETKPGYKTLDQLIDVFELDV